MSQKDYYKILGVDKNASSDDIKKAFRKLAHKYHPDKQGGDEQKFKEAGEAYSVLSDEKKRREYDHYGRVFSGGGESGGGQGFGGFDFGGFDFAGGQGFQDADFDLSDLFGEFFGGTRRSRAKRGRDISIDLEVPFRDAVFGTERSVLLSKIAQCNTCGGTGAKPGTQMKTCQTCAGAGKIHETKSSFFGTFSMVRPCSACAGQGSIPEAACTTCNGKGVEKRQEEIMITIPAGINDGEMIRLSSMGEATPQGVPGDLYVKVHVKPDPNWRKEGNNLVTDLPVKLTDALLGGTYTVDTLDGPLSVKIPQGIAHGEMLRVRGKGVPLEGNRRGDLLIRVTIPLPKKLSKQAQEAVKKLREEGI